MGVRDTLREDLGVGRCGTVFREAVATRSGWGGGPRGRAVVCQSEASVVNAGPCGGNANLYRSNVVQS